MTRILFLNDVPGDLGGGEYQLISLIQGLVERGWGVEVACIPDSPLAERLADLKVTTHAVATLRSNPVAAVMRINRLCSEHSIDIIHTSSFLTDLSGRLAARLSSLPVVTTVHCEPDAYRLAAPGFRRALIYFIRRVVDKATRSRTSMFIAVSQAVANKLAATGIPRERIKVISNGIDSENVRRQARAPLAETWRTDSGLRIGTMARFDPVKGLGTIIEATTLLKDQFGEIKTFLIGDGPQRAQLEQMTLNLGLEGNIVVTGRLENPYPLLSSLDVYVVSSKSEGQNMTVLDAMALGRPVVATAVGGITDMVEDGDTGLLVPSGDAEALAGALAALLNDETFRNNLAEAGRRRAEQFTLNDMIEGTIAVHKAVVGDL